MLLSLFRRELHFLLPFNYPLRFSDGRKVKQNG